MDIDSWIYWFLIYILFDVIGCVKCFLCCWEFIMGDDVFVEVSWCFWCFIVIVFFEVYFVDIIFFCIVCVLFKVVD